ncbi:gap junction gamma-1 protein-like [Genypterus blacodes]|uniref:gap junction gamma-1 protein-like n=1 Tax=Genypterus blacodes TaxID=154954 RepID=UPI003F765E30
MRRSFLIRLLDELSNHTFVEKVWLTLLIVYRIALLAVGGEVHSDEQSEFVCVTHRQGCEKSCYDASSPLSLSRFWVFQVLVIATPTIMYLVYAVHKICGDYEEAGDNLENPRILEETSSKKHYGLMKVYVFQLLMRAIFECSFLIGQYFMYGLEVAPSYICTGVETCQQTVECFVSRPTEKTICLRIMYAASALCLLFTLLEILHLSISAIRDCCCTPRSHPTTVAELKSIVFEQKRPGAVVEYV